MADLLLTYQLPLIFACFALGAVGALILFKSSGTERAWQLADVIWVALGGIGAVVAIAAGIYQEDSTALNRQITVTYTASRAFDADAARFRLRYCADTRSVAANTDLASLCEKVEFLSASSAANTALPLFLSVTERKTPLAGFSLLLGRPQEADAMEEAAASLNMAEVLAFDTRDVPTVMALQAVQPTRPEVAADYRVLALTYDQLIVEITGLRAAWARLQSGKALLALQVIALCLVSFAAPFRLGRTIDGLV